MHKVFRVTIGNVYTQELDFWNGIENLLQFLEIIFTGTSAGSYMLFGQNAGLIRYGVIFCSSEVLRWKTVDKVTEW
ncbi:hypothetical protein MAR_026305 [Mya arenaria]|uniref:Uncharacterized protein n=1 Tax=Mya arenaria TaxID=6604 RepID=A0ABY7EQ66_MYAAR|nr:hypothetical protein MAR_026305 [Mya arenaria]